MENGGAARGRCPRSRLQYRSTARASIALVGTTPVLETWEATTIAGPLALRSFRPEWVDVQCQRQIGLRTRLPL